MISLEMFLYLNSYVHSLTYIQQNYGNNISIIILPYLKYFPVLKSVIS